MSVPNRVGTQTSLLVKAVLPSLQRTRLLVVLEGTGAAVAVADLL
jgi:hypothetical protein